MAGLAEAKPALDGPALAAVGQDDLFLALTVLGSPRLPCSRVPRCGAGCGVSVAAAGLHCPHVTAGCHLQYGLCGAHSLLYSPAHGSCPGLGCSRDGAAGGVEAAGAMELQGQWSCRSDGAAGVMDAAHSNAQCRAPTPAPPGLQQGSHASQEAKLVTVCAAAAASRARLGHPEPPSPGTVEGGTGGPGVTPRCVLHCVLPAAADTFTLLPQAALPHYSLSAPAYTVRFDLALGIPDSSLAAPGVGSCGPQGSRSTCAALEQPFHKELVRTTESLHL